MYLRKDGCRARYVRHESSEVDETTASERYWRWRCAGTELGELGRVGGRGSREVWGVLSEGERAGSGSIVENVGGFDILLPRFAEK
jgi:hypothetical protein